MSQDVAAYVGSLRRFTLDEYHRLAETGIFDGEKVELLDGFLVSEPAPSPEHAFVVDTLTHVLARSLPEPFRVRVQNPVTFTHSEPQPDLAVVEWNRAELAHAHPAWALLVIEVASGTLSRDRGPKAAIYARAAIPEYWIVNLPDRCVEVLRDPDPATGRYRTREVVAPPGQLHARSVPLPPVDVDALLPS